MIWDFSGNVWSWVDETVETDRAWASGADPLTDNSWVEVNQAVATDAMPHSSYRPLNAGLTNGEPSSAADQVSVFLESSNVGRMHPCPEGEVNGVIDSGTMMRGGNYMHGYDNAGIYALGMGYAPDTDHLICQVGFRCAYSVAGESP